MTYNISIVGSNWSPRGNIAISNYGMQMRCMKGHWIMCSASLASGKDEKFVVGRDCCLDKNSIEHLSVEIFERVWCAVQSSLRYFDGDSIEELLLFHQMEIFAKRRTIQKHAWARLLTLKTCISVWTLLRHFNVAWNKTYENETSSP